MKMKDLRRAQPAAGLILSLVGIACIVLSIAIAFPYESRGGALREAVEIEEEAPALDIDATLLIKPLYMRAEIVSLAVKVEEGHYIGEAELQTFETEDIGQITLIAVIPSNRVQRMFELAMARGLQVEAWGYKVASPAGHELAYLPFYRIISASVSDPDIGLRAALAVEP